MVTKLPIGSFATSQEFEEVLKERLDGSAWQYT
jgi:hypothetical protein